MVKYHMKLDANRMVKFCGMLGSEHEGERANAAKMATSLLRGAGLTWEQYLVKIHQPAPDSRRLVEAERLVAFYRSALATEQARTSRLSQDLEQAKKQPREAQARAPIPTDRTTERWGMTCTDIIAKIEFRDVHKMLLTDWERSFLASLLPRGGLTERQWWVIEKMALKAGVIRRSKVA